MQGGGIGACINLTWNAVNAKFRQRQVIDIANGEFIVFLLQEIISVFTVGKYNQALERCFLAVAKVPIWAKSPFLNFKYPVIAIMAPLSVQYSKSGI